MIKVNNIVLFSNEFRDAMVKMLNSSKLRIDQAKRVQGIAVELDKMLRQARKDWVALADELIEVDEKGNYSQKDGGFVWKDTSKSEENKKRVNDFGLNVHEIDAPRFELKYFEHVGLSATDLSVLDGFFKSVDFSKANEPKKLKLV